MLEQVLALVDQASVVVRAIYDRGDARVDFKAPGDPVTDADREANALLCGGLSALYPDAALVGEESIADARGDRRHARLSIFVDPVDGTRDFVERTGEFAVMVGVVHDGRASLGVVKEPASGRTFAGAPGLGAFEIVGGSRRPLHVSAARDPRGARLVESRTRPSARLDALVKTLGLVSSKMGSAGVKGARVAAGEADAYVHTGTAGYLWDAAAVDAIVTAAGGCFTDLFGAPYDYRQPGYENARGLVACNQALHPILIDAISKTP